MRSREQRREAQACRRDNREAIEQLLVPLDAIVRGDLTVHAPVTAGPIGHAADAINAVVMALRGRVAEIDRQMAQAAGPVEQIQATARQLGQANEDQIEHMAAAERSMTDVAAEVEALAQQTAESAAGVRQLLELARGGAGLSAHVHEAAEGLQRRLQGGLRVVEELASRWREVDAVAELIYELADQANILSLNASIQAAQAGDAGRGFSVVAEEIQRLAERAGEATKRMEALAQALQGESQALAVTVEQSAAAAGDSASRAAEGVTALRQLEQRAIDLAEQVVRLDEHAHAQASSASVLASAMEALRENSRYLAEVVQQAASSVTQLDGQLDDLKRWAGSFKLTA
jgi:twitching motility protein PilJ